VRRRPLTSAPRMYSIRRRMRRVPAVLLLLSVAAYGSGGLRYAHELDHLAAHARAAPGRDPVSGRPHEAHDGHDAHDGHEAHAGHGTRHADDRHGAPPDGHDPANGHGHGPGHTPGDDPAHCFIHSQLNLPLDGAVCVPVLVCAGRFVPFPHPPPAPAARSRRPALPLDARGPPALAVRVPQRVA
jgi:hypothetical protein